MKKIITIKQLVDEINDMSKNNEYDFKAKETPSETTIKLGRVKLMSFSSNGAWKIESGMGRLEEDIQHAIFDYANNSNSEFWFKEPKKANSLDSSVDRDKLEDDKDYRFAEKERKIKMNTTKQATVEEMVNKLNELKEKNGRETDYTYVIDYSRYPVKSVAGRACMISLQDKNGKISLVQFDEKNGLGGIDLPKDINDKISDEERDLINRMSDIFEFDMGEDVDRKNLFGGTRYNIVFEKNDKQLFAAIGYDKDKKEFVLKENVTKEDLNSTDFQLTQLEVFDLRNGKYGDLAPLAVENNK